jgi:AraC family transcriptional regulator, alkane utilization regulator
MDALSEVLQAVRLDGAIYITAEFTAPWCVQTKFGLRTVAARLPRADHVVFFHMLTGGRALARLADGGETTEVRAGDVLLFPHDDLHVLGSDPSLAPAEREPTELDPEGRLIRMQYGGGGELTEFVCGYLACDRRIFRSLLSSLPRMMRVSIAGDGETSWLLQMLEVGVRESRTQNPGATSLLAKLAELLFVEATRRYAASLPSTQKGWLAGLRDPQIGRALALLHARPADPWTVEALARSVGMSRSVLAERFVDLIGEPPMQYLTSWRLALAAQALRTSNETIARISERCGYESEAAFNRAFKREFAKPPAAWRKQHANEALREA